MYSLYLVKSHYGCSQIGIKRGQTELFLLYWEKCVFVEAASGVEKNKTCCSERKCSFLKSRVEKVWWNESFQIYSVQL